MKISEIYIIWNMICAFREIRGWIILMAEFRRNFYSYLKTNCPIK